MFNKLVYKKLFILFLSVVLSYTLLVIGIMFYKSYQMLAIKNNYVNQIYLDKTSKNTDYKIEVALNYTESIAKKESVSNYLDITTFDYPSFSAVYSDLLASFDSVEQLGFTVALFKPNDEQVVSSNGYFTYQDYLKFIQIPAGQLADLSGLFKEQRLGSFYLVPEKETEKEQQYVTLVRKIYYPEAKKNIFFLITFEKQQLLPNNLPNGVGYFSLKSKETTIASYKSPSYQNNDLQINQNSTLISPQKPREMMNFSTPSKIIAGLDYLYLIRKADHYKLNAQFVKDLILPNIFLALLGALIIVLATKKSYSPIQAIVNSFSSNNKNLIPLRPTKAASTAVKFNELDYIINNIQQINQANSALQKSVESSLSTLQESFLKNALYGLTPQNNLNEALKNYALMSYQAGGSLAILSLEGISELESNLTKQNILSLRGKLLTVLNKTTIDTEFISIPIDYKKFCLIFTEKNPEKITDVLNQIIYQLEQELSLDLTFSLAAPVASFEELAGAYKEALTLINDRYLYLDAKIISPESMIFSSNESYSYSLDHERFLINAIKNNDLPKARLLLTEILEQNFKVLQLDIYNQIKFKYSLLNTLKRILNSYDKSMLEFSNTYQSLFKHLNTHDANQLYDTCLALFECFFQDFLLSQHSIQNPTVTNILDFIQTNYTQDLSLTTISQHFNLSEGYIGKLLKEVAHINFKSYVNSLKVEKAKELLAKGRYNVSEVSELVGIKNVNTFIRMFKRHEGLSPGEFMRAFS